MRTGLPLLAIAMLLVSGIAFPNPESAKALPEVRLKDGRVFKNVMVKSRNGDSVTVFHSGGATTIRFGQLTDQAARDLGMSREAAEKAAAAREAATKEAAGREYERKLIDSIVTVYCSRLSGKVLQVLNGGVLVSDSKIWRGSYQQLEDPDRGITHHFASELEAGTTYVKCDTSGRVDGEFFTAIVYDVGTFSYTDLLSSKRVVKAHSVLSESSFPVEPAKLDHQVPKLVSKVISAAGDKLAVERMHFKTASQEAKENGESQ